jgi:hypothetical protein
LPHVRETARLKASSGAIVLLADITNFIGSGDLVCLDPEGGVEIVECKAGGPDAGGARGRRQRERLEALADYLETGVEENESPGQSTQRIAIDAPSAKDDDSVKAMQETVAAAIEAGSATLQISEHELVLVGSDGASPGWPAKFRASSGVDASSTSFLGFSSDLVNEPSCHFAPVTLWDVPFEHRVALWEKDLVVAHCVSSAGIVGPSLEHPHVEVTGVGDGGEIEVTVTGTQVTLPPRFIGQVLYDWTTPAALREQVCAFAAVAVAIGEQEAATAASTGERPRISFQ